MQDDWKHCKNLLCVRADNIGDVIMSGPAIRALKETFRCRITLLTSSAGALIAPHIEDVDDVMVWDTPWVKTCSSASSLSTLITELKTRSFDGAVIFTVYSQSPLPAALLLYMANIPRRLAYCRENPYELLTDWVPDCEPYYFIQHQVIRDISLVKHISAHVQQDNLRLSCKHTASVTLQKKFQNWGLNEESTYILIHPGVSEAKRQYPVEKWKSVINEAHQATGLPVIISGSSTDVKLAEEIAASQRGACINAAGQLTIAEWIILIKKAAALVSVNTGAVHIAAATNTACLVLYALTNPQHTPWKVRSVVMPFPVPENMESRNKVINYINRKIFDQNIECPPANRVVSALVSLLNDESLEEFRTDMLVTSNEKLNTTRV